MNQRAKRESGWLRRAWGNASQPLRAACVAMWAAGTVAAVGGGIGDYAGWWDDLPFLTNLASTVTGALFGVPLALVFFQGIAATETEKRGQRDIVMLARATIGEILHDVTNLTTGVTDLDDLQARIQRVEDELLPLARIERTPAALATMVKEWRQIHDLWFQALIPAGDTQRRLRNAEMRWRFIKEHVQPQLVRQRLGWISTEDIRHVNELFAAVSVHYQGAGDPEEELLDAADALIGDGSTAPLGRYFGGGHYAIVAGMEEHVEQLRTTVAAIVDLTSAIRRLAAAQGWGASPNLLDP